MKYRDKRLWWENNQLEQYLINCPVNMDGQPLAEIINQGGTPPTWYHFIYRIKGLVRDPQTEKIAIAINHKVEFQMNEDYPFCPPTIQVISPIFHPNIGDGIHGGRVCLAADYNPNITLSELVQQVGEMIRLAKYWEVSETQDVYRALRQYHYDQLPVDDSSLFPPTSGNPPQLEHLQIEIPMEGVMLMVSNPNHLPLNEIVEQIIQEHNLPSHTKTGHPIHYAIQLRESEQDIHRFAIIRDSEFDIAEFLEQVRTTNPDKFDFFFETISSSQEHLYRLQFKVETLAPAITSKGNQVYIRTRNNQAQLHVYPKNPSKPVSVTWLTPIFHPYLEQNTKFYSSKKNQTVSEVMVLFKMLTDLLAYRSIAGLELKSKQALEWVEQNSPYVEWLQKNNSSFKLTITNDN